MQINEEINREDDSEEESTNVRSAKLEQIKREPSEQYEASHSGNSDSDDSNQQHAI